MKRLEVRRNQQESGAKLGTRSLTKVTNPLQVRQQRRKKSLEIKKKKNRNAKL